MAVVVLVETERRLDNSIQLVEVDELLYGER